MFIYEVLLSLLCLYAGIYATYHSILLISHFFIPPRPATLRKGPTTRFAIIIPAHNEELYIGRLLSSLAAQDYPRSHYHIFVIADNCDDQTINIASSSGATVLERKDLIHVGKGYALQYALAHIPQREFDAVIVIDADSCADSRVLAELDALIADGARIIQCATTLINMDESWISRLEHTSRIITNKIYNRVHGAWGLSVCLIGNGMCITMDVLTKYGWHSFSVSEDQEYFAELIEHGERVAFAEQAIILMEGATSMQQATKQRERWAGGRFDLFRRFGWRLLTTGIRTANLAMIDASLWFIFPNPSLGLTITIFGLSASLLYPPSAEKILFVSLFSVFLAAQCLMFLTGVMYTKMRISSLLAIFFVPIFLGWKLGIDLLVAFKSGKRIWTRTERIDKTGKKE